LEASTSTFTNRQTINRNVRKAPAQSGKLGTNAEIKIAIPATIATSVVTYCMGVTSDSRQSEGERLWSLDSMGNLTGDPKLNQRDKGFGVGVAGEGANGLTPGEGGYLGKF